MRIGSISMSYGFSSEASDEVPTNLLCLGVADLLGHPTESDLLVSGFPSALRTLCCSAVRPSTTPPATPIAPAIAGTPIRAIAPRAG